MESTFELVDRVIWVISGMNLGSEGVIFGFGCEVMILGGRPGVWVNFRYRSSKGDGGKLIGWVNRVGTGRRGVNHIMVHLWGRTICGVTLSKGLISKGLKIVLIYFFRY